MATRMICVAFFRVRAWSEATRGRAVQRLIRKGGHEGWVVVAEHGGAPC